MKQFSKMSHGRSSSCKTRAAAHVTEKNEAGKIIFKTIQKGKIASLYEEEEEEEDGADHQLRPNPGKACKTSSSKNGVNHQKKFICTKCGKAFQSSKAMCGHMACHSWKDKASTKIAAKQKMEVMDSESDTESRAQKLRRRFRFKKQKSVAGWKPPKVDVFNRCSSGVSGIEQEQEEGAISLMMLSRDSAHWCGLNSVGDSSDNNSVVLEDRSTSTKLGIRKNGLIFDYDVNENMEHYRSKKVKTLGDSESGFVGNEAENVGTDVKIKKLNKVAELSKIEPHSSLKKLKTAMDGDYIQRPEMDSFSTKSVSNESAEMCKRFENRAQHSYRPFNANVASHKSSTAASVPETDAYRNQHKGKGILEHNSSSVGYKWKKGKKHECPMCSKVFRSCQALGSHMRVHSAEEIKGDEVAANFKRKETQFLDSIDLNLPVPTEDEEASVSLSVANY